MAPHTLNISVNRDAGNVDLPIIKLKYIVRYVDMKKI